ncbi:hypothetical protein NQ318_016006 [Aromia moschata]|uniref:Uncharacterized protein n=1 Tax=Aromia moschata TaxID=1265417 RepID=A0AAV8Y379_9CUCU|nr:hypothetical protein NQ318_016006 [Aromia moschata]
MRGEDLFSAFKIYTEFGTRHPNRRKGDDSEQTIGRECEKGDFMKVYVKFSTAPPMPLLP